MSEFATKLNRKILNHFSRQQLHLLLHNGILQTGLQGAMDMGIEVHEHGRFMAVLYRVMRGDVRHRVRAAM